MASLSEGLGFCWGSTLFYCLVRAVAGSLDLICPDLRAGTYSPYPLSDGCASLRSDWLSRLKTLLPSDPWAQRWAYGAPLVLMARKTGGEIHKDTRARSLPDHFKQTLWGWELGFSIF